AELAAAEREAERRWGTPALGELGRTIDGLHAAESQLDEIGRALRGRLLADDARSWAVVAGIVAAAPPLAELARELAVILTSYEGQSLAEGGTEPRPIARFPG